MEVTVRLFAMLREHAGTGSLPLDLPAGATVQDALDALGRAGRLPEGARESLVVAVNRDMASNLTTLTPGDELALLPPVSGGAGVVRSVRLTSDALDPGALERLVRDPSAGAVVVFCGTTRDVPHLEYEAYAEMAEPVLRRLAEEAAERHGLAAVAVEHRIGDVPLSEPSVVVAASAPHRGEAFEGARELIDRLKVEAPIWKAEHSVEGEKAWVEGQRMQGPGRTTA